MKKFINLAVTLFLAFNLSLNAHAKPNNIIKPINIKKPYIKQEIKTFKNKIVGPTGLCSIFADKNKFLFLHGGGLLSFKSSEPNEIYSFINLQKLNSYCTQGDIVTDFSIDNTCNYAMVNNNLCYSTTKNDIPYMAMYFCNLAKCTAKKISTRNSKYIIKSWSSNSKYFAFYDKSSNELMLFDTNLEALKKICNYRGNVSQISAQDNGSILLNCNGNKIYNVNIKGQMNRLNNGSLICSDNCSFIYFNNSKIFEHKSKNILLYSLGKGLNLKHMDENQAIFSSGSIIKVFNKHSKKLYTFNGKFKDEMIFSPDSQKYLYNKTDNSGKLKVVFYNGKTTKVDNLSTQPYSSLCTGYYIWIDNNSLAHASLQSEKKTPDHFKIEKINVFNGVRTIYQTELQ